MILRRGWILGLVGRIGGRAGLRSGADGPPGPAQAGIRCERTTRAAVPPAASAQSSQQHPARARRGADGHLREPAGAAGRARRLRRPTRTCRGLSRMATTVVMAAQPATAMFSRIYSGASVVFLDAPTDRLIGTAQATFGQPIYKAARRRPAWIARRTRLSPSART